MKLINIETDEPVPSAEHTAKRIMHNINASLNERVHEHKAGFGKFWNSKDTPDDILISMGGNAIIFLLAASENLEHITRLAGIVGKSLTDFIAAEDFMPPRVFIPSKDGTVTLAPSDEGYDAWGREIIPETAPEKTPETEII